MVCPCLPPRRRTAMAMPISSKRDTGGSGTVAARGPSLDSPSRDPQPVISSRGFDELESFHSKIYKSRLGESCDKNQTGSWTVALRVEILSPSILREDSTNSSHSI
jgi:hypothetical protein